MDFARPRNGSTPLGAVGVTATIAAPEIAETVVFSATSAGSTPVAVTVAAAGTSVPTSLNLTPLLGGTLTVTARTKDAAGNLSATRAPVNQIMNQIIEDVTVPALTASYSGGFLELSPTVSGSPECGARIAAARTADSKLFTMTIGSGNLLQPRRRGSAARPRRRDLQRHVDRPRREYRCGCDDERVIGKAVPTTEASTGLKAMTPSVPPAQGRMRRALRDAGYLTVRGRCVAVSGPAASWWSRRSISRSASFAAGR